MAKMFKFSIQDNDSYAFRERPEPWTKDKVAYRMYQKLTPNMSGESMPSIRRCNVCGAILAKWEEPLNGLKVKKRRLDISCTFDGVSIVSQRFKDVVESNALIGLEFTRLPDDGDFYSIQATHIVHVDPEKSMTRFVEQCPTCGIYESVVGPYTVLREGETIPECGFARTDLEFASGDEKHPQLLCGQEVADVLLSANLKGVDLIPFDV